MDRRDFVRSGSALLALALAPSGSSASLAEDAPAAAAPPPFSRTWLIEEARRLAGNPYQAPPEKLPDEVAKMTYDAYRDIRFRPEARLWGSENLPFALDLFHPGFYFRTPVHISVVDNGVATELSFSPDLFEYGPQAKRPDSPDGLFFTGLRVRAKINTPDVWDEFLVFQGASYFRAIARDQLYGLSARAVAIDTAEPKGEEFPAFTHFWIIKPDPHADTLTIHALLDSPSMTGAYQFTVIPGGETVITVEGTIFARQEITKLGIAPLTSMFVFDASNRNGHDDFRPAAHDSDGLQMLTSSGEWVWRQLANPRDLQLSAFADTRPRGFGLMQRKRRYEDFEDLEAAYERRPSLWIEPMGDWGKGFVELVEIPTANEYNDNIVAYWRPDGHVPVGGPYNYAYRMRWTDVVKPGKALLTVQQTRIGLTTTDGKRRLFVIDFDAPVGVDTKTLAVDASASAGALGAPVIHEGAPDRTVRVSFDLDTSGIELSELRLRLTAGGAPASETWLYRWTAR